MAVAVAVLGHAARRLGGSGTLRRTQEAAVSRLSSRFAHTEAVPGCRCGGFERDGVLNQLQKQKEELYDAAAEAHRKYGTENSLLRELTDHVNRPGDPTWDRANLSQLNHDLLKAAGVVGLLVGGYKAVSGFVRWMDEK